MKLGKNEKKILVLALKNFNEKYRPDGISMVILAKKIYGEKEAYDYGELKNTVKASLSRSLHSLFQKKLLLKAKPIYERKWKKKDEYDKKSIGYMSKRLIALEIKKNNRLYHESYERIGVPTYSSLSYYTKIWWILTEEGQKIAEKLALENPELDELIEYYCREKKEEQRKRLKERCSRCWKIDYERRILHCDVKEMQGIEYETEDCSYYRLHSDFLV